MDNFLKKKKWKTVHSTISNNETAVKYFKAVGKVKYYNPTDQGNDSESDTLLSYDEEIDNKGHKNERSSPEEHRLLPEVT